MTRPKQVFNESDAIDVACGLGGDYANLLIHLTSEQRTGLTDSVVDAFARLEAKLTSTYEEYELLSRDNGPQISITIK